MRYDLTPLFRSTVGFDSLSRMMDMAMKMENEAPSYPPYNIEKFASNSEQDSYRISMAVAGFNENELNITAQDNALIVTGKQQQEEGESARSFLYRGIAARAFERRFQLADHIKVTGASLKHGLLHIDLVREVPEAKKPRTVSIQVAEGDGKTAPAIDQKMN